MTKATARTTVRALGFSFKWDAEWQEYIIRDAATGDTYHTDCIEDAVGTARAWAERNPTTAGEVVR